MNNLFNQSPTPAQPGSILTQESAPTPTAPIKPAVQIDKKKMTKIIIIVLVVLIVAVGGALVYSHYNNEAKVRDAKIISDLKQMRIAAETYYDGHANTYTGWQPDKTLVSDIQAQGSAVQSQVTDQQFTVTANLPKAKDYYCVKHDADVEVDKTTLDIICPITSK